jgi:two-component system, NarL family, sensor histidine kinase DegS
LDPDAGGLTEPDVDRTEAASTEGAAATVDGGEPDLASILRRDVATLDGELAEIEMLVQQARTEAERHEQKRAQAAEKLTSLPEATPTADALALSTQLVGLTRRAAVMEAQVEVLEGKRKALSRYRAGLSAIGEAIGAGIPLGGGETSEADADASADAAATPATPGMTRIVLGAQEDLRREIARQMHDGPAQSLTNIVLQAQIVERLMAGDPEMARGEVRQLVSMVQQTLDATKSFIFEVRPMVLDDLGLVPTIRRAARERGRRSGVAVEFESMGSDRRLPMELESGLFRVLDEAMNGYLSEAPDRVTVRLDWSDDRVEGRVAGSRDRAAAIEEAEKELAAQAEQAAQKRTGRDQLPPALASMMDERRERAEAAAEAARSAAIVRLPSGSWHEIEQRAATLGIVVEQLPDDGSLRISVDAPASDVGEAAGGTADPGPAAEGAEGAGTAG